MPIYNPSTFRLLQSGDDVRVTLKDNTTLDCTIRRFLSAENTIIATTPVGEDDPDLQTTYYIDDYVQILYPIPFTAAAQLVWLERGDPVEARWASGASGVITGTFIGYDINTGIVQIDDGTNNWYLREFWYVKAL